MKKELSLMIALATIGTNIHAMEANILRAIQQDNVFAVGEYIGSVKNVNIQDKAGATLLHRAAQHKASDSARFLIGEGAKVNTTSRGEETPLHKAVRSGSVDIVDLLINSNANVNATTTAGKSPLHLAVLKNNPYIVWFLIDKGANVSVQDRDGNTSLHLAAKQGHWTIARILIDQGTANINAKNRKGETPLHEANKEYATQGTVIMIEKLIARRADINAQNNDGNTPLHEACTTANPPTKNVKSSHKAQVLVAKGARVDIKNKNNQTQLDLAPVHLKNGLTALMAKLLFTAIANNNVAELDKRLNQGIDINIQNKQGKTALHIAVLQNNRGAIKGLLTRGANPTIKDSNGETPVHIAAQVPELLTIFIEATGLPLEEPMPDPEIEEPPTKKRRLEHQKDTG